MSPEESALRAAIIADPDSDLPRLVFADYLEEHGRTEYAEFLRVQIELARTDPEDESRLGLHLRERELLRILKEELDAEKPELPEDVEWDADLRRGFVDRVEFSSEVSSEFAERQLETAATVAPLRGVIDGFGPALPEFIRSPAFARIDYLNDHGEFDADGLMTALAETKYADRLRHLDLPFLDLSNADLAVLAGAKSLRRLTRLESGWGPVTSAARPRLQAATWRKSLRELRLFSGEKFHLAAKGVTFPELRSLFLFGVELARPLVAVLNDTACLPRLTDLELFGNHFGTPDKSRKIAPLTRPLTALSLERIDLGPEGFRRLFDTPTAATLRTFKIDCVEAGKTWLTDLAAAELPRLRSFTLDGDDQKTKPDPLVALAAAPFWATVEELEITRFKSDTMPATWAAFFRALNAPRLRRLHVWWSSIGAAGLKALAANPSLAGLRWLELRNCGMTDPGLRAVLESPHLQRLVLLEAEVRRGGEAFDLLGDPAVLPHARRIDITGSRASAAQAKKIRARGVVKIKTK